MKLENIINQQTENKTISRRNFLSYLGGAITYFGSIKHCDAMEKQKDEMSTEYWTKKCFSVSTIATNLDTCYYMTTDNKEYTTIIGGAGVNLSENVGIFGIGYKDQVGFTLKIPKGTPKEEIEKRVIYEMEKIGQGTKSIWQKLCEKNGSLFDFKTFIKPQRVLYIPRKNGIPDLDYIGSDDWKDQIEKVLKQYKKDHKK